MAVRLANVMTTASGAPSRSTTKTNNQHGSSEADTMGRLVTPETHCHQASSREGLAFRAWWKFIFCRGAKVSPIATEAVHRNGQSLTCLVE